MKTKSRLIKSAFSVLTIFLTIGLSAQSQAPDKFTIIIDAGHGGHDSGTTGNVKNKEFEKHVVLDVALKFGDLIEKNMKNVEVVYTRTTDTFVKLKDRPVPALKNNADLFVSIHANANPNSSANGAETYVLGMHKSKTNFEVAKKENSVIFLEDDYSFNYSGFDPNNIDAIIGLTLESELNLEESLVFASLVQKNLKTRTPLKNRGVKQAGFWVLAKTSIPSVLIELGFLSNEGDSKFLLSEKGQKEAAESLYLALVEYKKAWDDKNFIIQDYSFETALIEEEDSPIKYAVQFLSTSTKLPIDYDGFKGLKNITYYQEDGVYKYLYYKSSDYLEVIERKNDLKKLGFDGAFVVAFKNDKKISMAQALEEERKSAPKK